MGCESRSISNSGYNRYAHDYGYQTYTRELGEFDVLGIDQQTNFTDEDIQNAFNNQPIEHWLKSGDRIMLIQSGAQIPDPEMITPLSKHFNVQAFTGIIKKHREVSSHRCNDPGIELVTSLIKTAFTDHAKSESTSQDSEPQNKPNQPSYATSMRMAAAKAGINTIMVYWGTLESEIQNHETKAVSWVPIAGMIVPDETQHMRIRLKVVLIDVKSGQWQMFTPNTYQDQSLSASLNRAASDQKQVLKLKTLAYAGAVEELVTRYGKYK
ncbi:MAG: hypothetical protein CMJ19_21710 [Phycisphaeraceae bacterium]|nr:hypothetical protein [Phycisphaeraceae bacterium]